MLLQLIDQEIVRLINRYAESEAKRSNVDIDDTICATTDIIVSLINRGKSREDVLKMIKRASMYATMKLKNRQNSRRTFNFAIKTPDSFVSLAETGCEGECEIINVLASAKNLTPETERLRIIREHVGVFGYLLALGYTSRQAAVRCNCRPTKRIIERLRRETREKIEQLEQQGLYLHENDWADYAI